MFTCFFASFCLWIGCTIPVYYGLLDLTSNYPLIFHLLLTFIFSNVLFFILIYTFRSDAPMLHTQIHAYPHKYIAPFLSSAVSFNPTPWLFNRYLETYIPAFIKVPLPFDTTQEIINVKADNEHYSFDGQCSITWTPLTPTHLKYPRMSPILIIVPGLTGDINAKYCRRMMIAAHKNGWQAVIFNPRYTNVFIFCRSEFNIF